MSGNDHDYLQNLMDENYVMLKDLKEQQQRFSVNYERQLDSIKDQHTKLAKTLNQQQEINSSLKGQIKEVSFSVKFGFGGILIGVFGLLIASGIWWHAHQEFKDNQDYAQVLANVKAELPLLASKDGSTYVRIVKDSQDSEFLDKNGRYVDGYYAKVYQGDDS